MKFKRQTIEQLDILTKWCKAHNIEFSGQETNIITSAMVEYADIQVKIMLLRAMLRVRSIAKLASLYDLNKMD